MNPLNPSDRDCRIAKRQLAVGNQAAAGTPAARIATNLHIPLATVMAAWRWRRASTQPLCVGAAITEKIERSRR